MNFLIFFGSLGLFGFFSKNRIGLVHFSFSIFKKQNSETESGSLDSILDFSNKPRFQQFFSKIFLLKSRFFSRVILVFLKKAAVFHLLGQNCGEENCFFLHIFGPKGGKQLFFKKTRMTRLKKPRFQ